MVPTTGDGLKTGAIGMLSPATSESKIISNIVESVDTFVSISVRSSHSSANVSMFLFGRVNVSASVSNIVDLILSLELRADGASNMSISLSSCGSSGSRSSSSRGSELSYALVRTFSRVLNFWASEEFSSVRFLQLILGREIGFVDLGLDVLGIGNLNSGLNRGDNGDIVWGFFRR